jgi:hypothetical protein
VTASNAWPASIERWTKGRKSGGSTGCNENTQLAPSEQNRSSKSADGRVATVATRQEKKPCPTTKQENSLDSDRPSHGRRSRKHALFVRSFSGSISAIGIYRQLRSRPGLVDSQAERSIVVFLLRRCGGGVISHDEQPERISHCSIKHGIKRTKKSQRLSLSGSVMVIPARIPGGHRM